MTTPVGPHAGATTEGVTSRLARLAARGTLFSLAGRGVIEGLRFASNLLLTRLLAPEAFGLMAIANAVSQGTRMMTDLGVRGSVVQHARGDDPTFLNTAWTIQILRGAVVAVTLCAGAGFVAEAFAKPEATMLIRAVALCALIDGFQSTAGHTLLRKIRVGRQALRDVTAKAIGIAVMLAWALAIPSVWALVAGAIAGSLAQLWFSHRLIPGYSNRLAYDKPSARSIARFGRWVLVASLMTFVLQQGDRLALGKLMTATELGVYAIALGLTQTIPELLQAMSVNILFPVYARLGKLEIKEQRREVERYRFVILAIALPGLWALTWLGQDIVHFLYDARYTSAGWMVQLLAASLVPVALTSTAERALMARGDSFSHMLVQTSQAALVLGGLLLGYLALGDTRGVLLGLVLGRWLGYVPLAFFLRRIGLWLPRLDGIALLVSALVIAGALHWRGAP